MSKQIVLTLEDKMKVLKAHENGTQKKKLHRLIVTEHKQYIKKWRFSVKKA